MSGSSAIRLRIKTRERRYILQDVEALERLLRKHGAPIEYVPGRPETRITTVYVDTREGTWSTGLTQTKLRVRNYGTPDAWWFELKRRTETRVDKWRRPMTAHGVRAMLSGPRRWRPATRLVGDEALTSLFAVRCRRIAFEWPGLRVTLDRDITFFGVGTAEPLQPTCPFGHITGVVVEVKRESTRPDWLTPLLDGQEAAGYSKSRYALALRAGRERPFLAAELPPIRPTVEPAALIAR